MKRMLITCVYLALVVGLLSAGTASGEVIDAPSTWFSGWRILNLPNSLLQRFGSDAPISFEINEELEDVDCGWGNITVEVTGFLSFKDPAYVLYFQQEPENPQDYDHLFVVGVTEQPVFDGALIIHFNNCLGFVSFPLGIALKNVHADKAQVNFVANTFYNEETEKVVLTTEATQVLMIECYEWSGDECVNEGYGFDLGEDWPAGLDWIKEDFEILLHNLIMGKIGSFIGDQGELAVTGDGGVLHDLVEDLMDPFYRGPPQSWGAASQMSTMGSVDRTARKRQVLLNCTFLLILPAVFVLCMKRRRRAQGTSAK